MELALDVESILPQFIRRRFVVKSRTIRPNENRHHNSIYRCLMDESELSSEVIFKALNPGLVGLHILLPITIINSSFCVLILSFTIVYSDILLLPLT